MTLEEMNIPASIKIEAADLIRRIDLADGLLELSTIGGIHDRRDLPQGVAPIGHRRPGNNVQPGY